MALGGRIQHLLLLVLLMVEPGWAQFNTATLAGTVQDITGGLLPGATVTAVHRGTGAPFKQLSDANGEYALINLPVGEYVVSVEAEGFKHVNRTGIVLEI